jgi:hypothetical protein
MLGDSAEHALSLPFRPAHHYASTDTGRLHDITRMQPIRGTIAPASNHAPPKKQKDNLFQTVSSSNPSIGTFARQDCFAL